jgi:hypothetical protein
VAALVQPDRFETGCAPPPSCLPAEGLIRERATVRASEEEAAAPTARQTMLEQVLAKDAGDRDSAPACPALRRHAAGLRVPAPLNSDHVGVEVDQLVGECLELAGPEAGVHGRGPDGAIALRQGGDEARRLGGRRDPFARSDAHSAGGAGDRRR